MSVKLISNSTLDIYIKKELLSGLDLKNKDVLEEYLKRTFRILKSKYNIVIEGFYEVKVYIDKFYGIVLHLENDNLEYYNYFKNQVDMKISILDTDFFYEVDDIPVDIFNKVKIHLRGEKIYLKLNNKLSNIEMMRLMENSKLVYSIGEEE